MERVRSILKSLALITLLTVFLGCAATPASRSVDSADDARIARDVSAAFFQEPSLRTSQINVKTTNGVVRLTGVVEKAPHVETATRLAGGVPGVVQVKSELSVKE